MKKMKTVWFALSCLVFFAAPAASPVFTKVKVETEFYAAPAASFKGGGISYSVSTRTRTASKWLMIKVEYTPALEKNTITTIIPRANEQHVTTRGWLDNVELSVRVLFDTGLVYQKRTVYGLFSGKSLLWTIRQDGQKHMALMFVPAQLIDRYSTSGNAAGIIRQTGKNNFIVEAAFSCDGTFLGKSFYNLPASKTAQQQFQFEQLLKNVPRQLRIENSVLPQSKTPWAGYYPDAFDLEKEYTTPKR